MWNCGEAIQVVSDAVVRNNLILNSTNGITAAPHARVAQMSNVTIVNNTIYGHSTCVFVRWSGAANMILASNALYCPGATWPPNTGRRMMWVFPAERPRCLSRRRGRWRCSRAMLKIDRTVTMRFMTPPSPAVRVV